MRGEGAGAARATPNRDRRRGCGLGSEALYGAVDIGGTSAKIGLLTRSGRVLGRRRVERPEAGPAGAGSGARATGPTGPVAPARLVDLYCAALDELLSEIDLAKGPADHPAAGADRRLAGVGVSICGYVTDEGLPELTNLPLLDGYPIVRHLQRRYGVPVAIDNDVNAAALGEYRFGAGRGARRLVMAAVGYGIGVAAILDGRLVRFTGGTTGNLGHLLVDPDSRERCGLGCRGCLETKAAAPALERRAALAARRHPDWALGRRLAAGGRLTVAEVKAAAEEGDPLALELLREAGRWLGAGLATFGAVFSPDVIVVGGGLSEIGPVVEAAAASFHEMGMPYVTSRARVVPAALGNDAALVGAAAALWDDR